MSLASLLADIRSAWRGRLLSTPMPAAGPIALDAAGQVWSAAGTDFGAAGFVPGDFVSVQGAVNLGPTRVLSAEDGSITVSDVLAIGNAEVTVSVELPPPAWEGELYEPASGLPYVAEAVRFTDRSPSPMGGVIRSKILATATLFYPAGQGTLGIESMAGRVSDQFRPGVVLSRGASAGMVQKCDQTQLLQESEWISCSVTASVIAWSLN